ncbi:hypothetical protein BSKO_00582 [Bryopsis sp. KO-2023]|nr:hypothetical protein BSKO_00582 [Bryopsis sp. KO-2023]
MGAEPVKMKKRKEKKEKRKKKKEKPTEQKAPDPKEAAQNTETLDEEVVCLGDGGGVKTDEKMKKNTVRSKKDKTVEKESVKEPPHGDAVATSQAPFGDDDSKSKSSKKKKSSKRKSLEAPVAAPEVIVKDAGETGDKKGKKNKNNKEEDLAPAGVQPEPSPAKSGAETEGKSKKKSKDKCEEAEKTVEGGQTQANGQVSCAAGAPAKTKAEENGAKTTPKSKKKKSKRKSEAGLQTPNSTADGVGKSDAGAAVVPNENGKSDNGVETTDGSQQEKDGHKKVKSKKKSKRKSEAGLQTPNSTADGVGKSDAGAAVVPNENGKSDNGVETADGSQQEKDGHKKVKPKKKKSKRKSEAGLQTPDSTADGGGKSDTGAAATEKSSKKSKKKRKKSDVVEASPTAPANGKPPAEEGQPPEKKAKTEGLDEGPKPDGNGQIPMDLTSTEGELASKGKEGLTSGAKAFRRVQANDWLDKKGALDNSYEATFGNEGWGAKAQEVLGKVRGKDFRHEKTKKKRGSYRGGVINSNAVNSTKFDSD